MNGRQRVASAVLVLAVVTTLTIAVTWPQALHLATRVGSHDDPLFSIWRMGWVAHSLSTDASRLFDGNIFHPVRNTLTFSDAMMLQGALGAPLLWAGASPILVYNLFLLAGFAASGLAMFVLARHVIQETGPALVSAAIFTMAPYRVEHFMHLELQWIMFAPLTLWAIHRTIESRSWLFALVAGVFLWLQILSSVYYGVFLALVAVLFVALLVVVDAEKTVRVLPALIAGGVLAVLLTVPYARPYLDTAGGLGVRPPSEVATYSASLSSYLTSPPQSLLWGWTARWGSPELNLFPGAVAIVLALIAVIARPRRLVVTYAVLAVVIIDLSRGLNGWTYSALFNMSGALHGLRSPSRFGILASCAIGVLAGFGAKALANWLSVRHRSLNDGGVAAGLVLLVAMDNATSGMILTDLSYQRANAFNVYKTIRALGPGPIIELPIARLDALPGREATYMFWSTAHWHPLVNGYSGYYPIEYAETVVRTERFPDDRSMLQLRSLGVRYIVVHRAFYKEDDYLDLLERILRRAELRPIGTFTDPVGEVQLFVLADASG
jgi:hypothetical protein